jgi:hypothetical protein
MLKDNYCTEIRIFVLMIVWLRHAKGRLVSLQLAFGWKSFGQVLT